MISFIVPLPLNYFHITYQGPKELLSSVDLFGVYIPKRSITFKEGGFEESL